MKKKFFGILAATTMAFLGMVLYRVSTGSTETIQVLPGSVHQFVESNLTEWASAPFVQIDTTAAFKEKLREILVIGDVGDLPAAARSGIAEAVHGFLIAFHTGNYDDYRRFRTPNSGFSFDDRKLAANKTYFEKFLKKNGEVTPSNPEELDRVLWERKYGGKPFNKYFTGVAIATATIEVDSLGSQPESLLDYVKKQKNAGLIEHAPTFLFKHSPRSVLQSNGKIFYFTFYGIISRASPDKPSPIYLRFYWEPDSQQWLPIEMVSTYVFKRARDPMF